MNAASTILLCADPQSPKWQVSRPRHGRLVLIGWTDDSPLVDAGVPSWAIEILAKTVTHAHRATFPSTIVRPDYVESCTPLTAAGFWRRLTSNRPHNFSLVTTERPAIVAEAFVDAGFPWWMQSQFIVMSPIDAPEPQMSSDEALGLLGAPETAEQLLHARKLNAHLSPCVDGDAAALITLNELDESVILTALHESAAAVNASVQTLDESHFSEQLATRSRRASGATR
jgi:hypothetical protein